MFVSLLVPVFVILLAAFTKRLIPSLIFGLAAGGILIAKGDPLSGMLHIADTILDIFRSSDSLLLILVLFLFGSFAELIKVSGGIKGFITFAEKRVKTERGVFLTVWLVSLVSFVDCCFHDIAAGTVATPLINKVGGNKRKLASIINITSCLLIILIPIGTTYAGFIAGTISDAMKAAGIQGSGYSLFLSSIPFNFYAILMTLFALVLSFTNMGFKRAIHDGVNEQAQEDSEHGIDEAYEQCTFEQKAAPRIFNLILPFLLLIVLIFCFLVYTGGSGGILGADFETSIFAAVFLTIIAISLYYRLQRMPFKEMEMHFLKGGGEMVPPIVILILSWGLSSVLRQLGFSDMIARIADIGIPVFLIPFIIYLICCAVSYFMGSAWGTWALVMPIALSLACRPASAFLSSRGPCSRAVRWVTTRPLWARRQCFPRR